MILASIKFPGLSVPKILNFVGKDFLLFISSYEIQVGLQSSDTTFRNPIFDDFLFLLESKKIKILTLTIQKMDDILFQQFFSSNISLKTT